MNSIEKALNDLQNAVKDELGVQTQLLSAVDAFRVLLKEQLDRVAHMSSEKVDFTKKEVVTIGLIDGDGIGPIIMKAARRVLEKLLEADIASGKVILKKIEGLTIENRLALNKSVPDDVLAAIKSCDVLLKGPTTTPISGILEGMNSGTVTMTDDAGHTAQLNCILTERQKAILLAGGLLAYTKENS